MPGAPDDAVFTWPDEWIRDLFADPEHLPPWVARMSPRERERKHWVALLRRHEGTLAAEVNDYGVIREQARAKVLAGARQESIEKRISFIAVVVHAAIRGGGGFVVAGLGPPLLFGYPWSLASFFGDAISAVILLNALGNLTYTYRFNAYRLLKEYRMVPSFSIKFFGLATFVGITGCRLWLARHGTPVYDVILREFLAFTTYIAWWMLTGFISWLLSHLRRGPDLYLGLVIGLLSSFAFAVEFREGRSAAKQDLVDELENDARQTQRLAGRSNLIPGSIDRELRTWMADWSRGVAAKLRQYKRLVMRPGDKNVDILVTSLANDFANACRDEWEALATPTPPPAQQARWRPVAYKIMTAGTLTLAAFTLPDLLRTGDAAANLRGTLIATAVFALISPLEKTTERAYDATKTALGSQEPDPAE